MERRGSGIEKIMEAYKNDKLKPQFEGNQHKFILTFYSRLYRDFTQNDTVNDTQNDTVNNTVKLIKTEKRILEEIRNFPEITANELAKDLNLGLSTIKRNIKTLKNKGLLERIGSDKNGCWRIKNI